LEPRRTRDNAPWKNFIVSLVEIFKETFSQREVAFTVRSIGRHTVHGPALNFIVAVLKPLGQKITGDALRDLLLSKK